MNAAGQRLKITNGLMTQRRLVRSHNGIDAMFYKASVRPASITSQYVQLVLAASLVVRHTQTDRQMSRRGSSLIQRDAAQSSARPRSARPPHGVVAITAAHTSLRICVRPSVCPSVGRSAITSVSSVTCLARPCTHRSTARHATALPAHFYSSGLRQLDVDGPCAYDTAGLLGHGQSHPRESKPVYDRRHPRGHGHGHGQPVWHDQRRPRRFATPCRLAASHRAICRRRT